MSSMTSAASTWSLLAWELTEARQDRLAARLEWSRRDLLAVFPFRHRLELMATLGPDRLTLETTLVANRDGPGPVSFGFHPYFGLPELPPADWRLQVPAMRRLVLDRSGIPTGEEEHFGGLNSRPWELDLHDGFAPPHRRPSFSLPGAGRPVHR